MGIEAETCVRELHLHNARQIHMRIFDEVMIKHS